MPVSRAAAAARTAPEQQRRFAAGEKRGLRKLTRHRGGSIDPEADAAEEPAAGLRVSRSIEALLRLKPDQVAAAIPADRRDRYEELAGQLRSWLADFARALATPYLH